MVASQALALERFLAGKGLAQKPGMLLAGLGARLQRASDLPAIAHHRESRPTGFSQLDQLLAGGLPKGAVLELVGRRSSGRFSVALAALAATTSSGEPAAFVDLADHFDPQAASDAGADLDRVLLVRPRRVKQALAAAEMLLSAGFPLVVVDLGFSPRSARFVPDAAWVRLARSAQSQSASLLLLSPWRVSGIAAESVVSTPPARPLWEGRGLEPRLLSGLAARVTVEKLGHATPARSADLLLRPPDALPGSEVVSSPVIPSLRSGQALSRTAVSFTVPGSRREESPRSSPSGGALRRGSERGVRNQVRARSRFAEARAGASADSERRDRDGSQISNHRSLSILNSQLSILNSVGSLAHRSQITNH